MAALWPLALVHGALSPQSQAGWVLLTLLGAAGRP